MPANFRKFDVKHGLSVNGLPFVDENRNVTLNNLTVQGTSTVVDTRTVSSVDPIISLGTSGSTYSIQSDVVANPGRFVFAADAFDDIAVGDAFEYSCDTTDAGGLSSGTVYFVVSKVTSLTSSNYRSITFAATQGGTEIEITSSGVGSQSITLNPMRDIGQDLGIEFNYVESGTAKKGFFGYDNSENHFTLLTDSTYGGSSSSSDSSAPEFTGTKAGAEFKYIKLEPTSALTASAPAIDVDQTWNEGSTTFETLSIDIVDTASAAASSLIDVKVGANQKLLLRKDGSLAVNEGTVGGVLSVSNANNSEAKLIHSTATWNDAGTVFTGINLEITDTASGAGSQLVNFYASDDRSFSINNFGQVVSEVEFTDGGVNSAYVINVTDTSSDPASKLLDLRVDDASKFSVDKDGTLNASKVNFNDEIEILSENPGNSTYENAVQHHADIQIIASGTTTATTIGSFPVTELTTAEYVVQVKQGSSIHSTKILLVHDGSDVYLTEYGTVYNNNILVTFDSVVSAGNVILQATKTAATVSAAAAADIKIFRLGLHA